MNNSKFNMLLGMAAATMIACAAPAIAGDSSSTMNTEQAFGGGKISQNSHPSMGGDMPSALQPETQVMASSNETTSMPNEETSVDEIASDVSKALSDIAPAAGDNMDSEMDSSPMNNEMMDNMDSQGYMDENFNTDEQKEVTP